MDYAGQRQCERLIGRAGAALALAMAAAACGPVQTNETETADRGQSELLNYLQTPQYRGPRRLRGAITLGFEASLIELCDNEAGPCRPHRNVDGLEQACWLEFAPSARRDLPARPADGLYLAEITGRLAVQPGMFGHLNQYSCQVEAVHVHNLRERDHLSHEPAGPNLVRGGSDAP
jgi:hypothetical protein